MRGIEQYQRYAELDLIAVIAVVTRASLDHVNDIYDFFKEIGSRVQLDIYDIRYADFLPSTGDQTAIFAMAPSPEEVGSFLIDLFDLWFYDESRRVDFNELRNEVKMILQPDVDRGDPIHKKRCDFRRVIFGPDGKAFSCDQYVNDEKTALGDIRRDSIEKILEAKERLWNDIKRYVRKSGDMMACSTCEWGRQCGGGCMTCMKYNSLLLRARAQGLEDDRWYEVEPTSPLREISGETYYCDGLRALRQHMKEAVERELSDGRE
jgi:radical SAM protein with 4Fe4S-binding SPASM domain